MSADTKRRITVAEVKAAVEKTGVRLKRGVTFAAATNCGCPLGIVAVATTDISLLKAEYIDSVQKALGLTSPYRFGFVQGFDHPLMNPIDIHDLDGWNDGRAVSLELLPPEKP